MRALPFEQFLEGLQNLLFVDLAFLHLIFKTPPQHLLHLTEILDCFPVAGLPMGPVLLYGLLEHCSGALYTSVYTMQPLLVYLLGL